MTASIIPAVIDKLVAECAARVPDGTVVRDGWGWQVETGPALFIGADDPTQRGRTTSGDADQEWASFAAHDRDEVATVTCAAIAWDGSGDAKPARDAAYALVDVVQAVLTEGHGRLDINGVIKAEIANARYQQDQTPDGALCVVIFDVRATARLI